MKRTHLVQYAAHAPNVALMVIRLISPDFGTGVVGRPCLRLKKAALGHLTHVEVAQLKHPILGEEHIGTLDVPMNDV